jgi:hypothetical protein
MPWLCAVLCCAVLWRKSYEIVSLKCLSDLNVVTGSTHTTHANGGCSDLRRRSRDDCLLTVFAHDAWDAHIIAVPGQSAVSCGVLLFLPACITLIQHSLALSLCSQVGHKSEDHVLQNVGVSLLPPLEDKAFMRAHKTLAQLRLQAVAQTARR